LCRNTLKMMKKTACLLSIMSAASGASILSPNSGWYLDSSIPASVQPAGGFFDYIASPLALALKDLKQDWYKVIGMPPTLLSEVPTGAWDGDAVVIFAMSPPGTAPAESFTVVAGAAGAVPTLTVTGADVRGLVYGIYHVSADFLGVDPFWWFNEAQPVYEPAGVSVVPSYAYASGAPAFDSRGGFNNDEDLSGYFRASPLGDAVYDTNFADRFCEALLRLRVNTLIPSTFAYIDESHYRVAAMRGLRLGNHHVMPVGNNVFAWPYGVSYAYRLNPGVFHSVWTQLADYALAEERRDVVFSLGYRGINDEPFWNMDTGCTTVECRGATITQAIANQSAIVKGVAAAAGVPAPRLVAYMWMELLQLKEEGTLILPPDVSCVWTDFPGAFLFEGGFDNVTAHDGFYGHISMMNGRAGQLTEFIPVARMFANVWQFWVRNATAYGMINLSDLKYVPLTAEAIFRYLWAPQAFNASAACAASTAAVPPRDSAGRRAHIGTWSIPRAGVAGCTESDFGSVPPEAAADAFVLEFSQRHYGAYANATAALYKAYFNISYMANAVPGQATLADHYLGSQLRTFVDKFEQAVTKPGGNATKSLVDAAHDLLAFTTPNYDYLMNLWQGVSMAVVPANAQRFYVSTLVAQTSIHFNHVWAMDAAAKGAVAFAAGDMTSAAANVTIALNAFEGLFATLRAAEGGGVWSGSYLADGWTWCYGSRQALAHLLAKLSGKVFPPGMSNPYPDYAFMTYETANPNPTIATPTFPFSVWSEDSWDALPRFACAGDIPSSNASIAASALDASKCQSTWVGVSISAASSVGFFTANY
jgi:hypothetical protein